MNKIRLILIFLCSVVFFDVQAQQIKRWTLSSRGRMGLYISNNKDSIYVESTFGSCPGCSVLNGGSVILREGFQQPLADILIVKDTTKTGGGGNGTTGLPPCKPGDPAGNFILDYNAIAKATACGTYYDFDYVGDDKPNMKFAWDFGTTGVPRFSINKNPKQIGFSSKGIKFIRLEAGVTCSKSITKTIDVTEDAFVAAATEDGDIKCKGERTSGISLNVVGGTPPYIYSWTNNLPSVPIQKGLGAGNYGYTVTDTKGCSFNSTSSIREPKEVLKIVAKVKDETCRNTKDGEITLTATGGTAPYDFLWSDNGSGDKRSNLSVGDLSSIIFAVTVTDDNSCTSANSNELKRYCDKTGKDFPNTFTPNDDGINDGWDFPGIDDYDNNKVEIFNRWGQLVYDKSSYKSGDWKGNNTSNQPLPAGPYYYVVSLNDRDKTVFSGAVTIIR